MKVELVAIAGNTLDTTPSFILNIDAHLYLFNVPDQTQRLFAESSFSMLKIEQIILTSATYESMGGLWGLVLTCVGINEYHTGVVAPKEFQKIYCANPMYSRHPEYAPPVAQEHNDEFVKIKGIPIGKTMAIEITLNDVQGKFLPKVAKEFGVPNGPLLKQLQSGKDVVLEDGTVVDASKCVGPSTKGEKLLVVDCRTLDDLNNLPDLCEYSAIIHLAKKDILYSKEYIAKFSGLNKEVLNFCFPKNNGSDLHSSNKFYERYRADYPEGLEPLANEESEKPPENFIGLACGDSYCFQPLNKKKLTQASLKANKLSLYEPELPKFDTFYVTFLGTGAKLPTKIRDTTGILIHTKCGFIVLDAGEGFLGQLRRKYGSKNTDYILKNIKAVWNSHEHADHIIGLNMLLDERAKLSDDIIPLMSDEITFMEMKKREEIVGPLYKVQYLNRDTSSIKLDCGITITSIPVKHCTGSCGVVVDIEDKYRIAFSGDHCKFDNFLERVGHCDLLIHEATFNNDQTEEDLNKMGHSDINFAVEAGKTLGAKCTVLTHISHRYKTLSLHTDEPGVMFAFDFLSFAFENSDEYCARFNSTKAEKEKKRR